MDSMNVDDVLGSLHQAENSAASRDSERFPVVACRENTWPLLDLARQLVTQGKPSLALQAVVKAIKSQGGGDPAVLQTLNRAQELYINRLRADAAADELASLFAECAIAEARPLNPVITPLEQMNAANLTLLQDASDTSILAQSGRMQIMLDAFSDGSSFICLKCGGLVSNHRKDEHLMYWCGSA